MNAWHAVLVNLAGDILGVLAVWAIAACALGAFLSRPQPTRRHGHAAPAKKQPHTRNEFTLAA